MYTLSIRGAAVPASGTKRLDLKKEARPLIGAGFRIGRLIASNTSGQTGVYLDRKRGKRTAQIAFKGKTCYFGSCVDKQEAIKARRRDEEMHDGFLEQNYARRPKIEGPSAGE